MSEDLEVTALRARVLELEEKIEFLYKHLGITHGIDLSKGEQKVAEELKKGRLIEAIKVYRQIYNVGLSEAKQGVERIQRSIEKTRL